MVQNEKKISVQGETGNFCFVWLGKALAFSLHAVNEATGTSLSSKEKFSSDRFSQYVNLGFVKWYEVLNRRRLKVNAIHKTRDWARLRWEKKPADHDRRTAGSAFDLFSVESIWRVVHVVRRDSFISQTTKCSQRKKVGRFMWNLPWMAGGGGRGLLSQQVF